MINSVKKLYRVGPVVMLLFGCGDSGSDHPTVSEAVAEFAPPFCGRLKECFGSSFDEAACVSALKSGVPADKANALDACTNDEIDTCVKDINSMSCPASATSASLTAVLPNSCKKC